MKMASSRQILCAVALLISSPDRTSAMLTTRWFFYIFVEAHIFSPAFNSASTHDMLCDNPSA